jgi:hypothetical protein
MTSLFHSLLDTKIVSASLDDSALDLAGAGRGQEAGAP